MSNLEKLSFDWLVIRTYFLFQLVGRLSQEELMSQLPSFLPALFDAFGNQSADVRKVPISFLFVLFSFLSLKRFVESLIELN